VPKKELRRILSKLGVASRTRADQWISEGRVRVNGQIIRQPERVFDPDRDRIEIDEKTPEKLSRRIYLFHKPKGVVTTHSDEKGRKTVFDVIGSVAEGMHAVGRLDMATTGLLILTNDTKFSAFMTNPANGIEREYIVSVRGKCSADTLTEAEGKIITPDETYSFRECEILKASGKESLLRVVLTEGKNREIRNAFSFLGHEVLKLKRIRYGEFSLGELAPGDGKFLE